MRLTLGQIIRGFEDNDKQIKLEGEFGTHYIKNIKVEENSIILTAGTIEESIVFLNKNLLLLSLSRNSNIKSHKEVYILFEDTDFVECKKLTKVISRKDINIFTY